MIRIRTFAVCLLAAGLAIALAGCGAKPTTPAAAGGTSRVTVRLLITEVPRGVGASITSGQVVKVKSTGVVVGTVSAVATTPSAAANPDAKGDLIESASPILDDVLITIEGDAVVSDTGFRFGTGNLYVNSQDEYLTPTTIVKGTIVSIEAAK